MEIVIKAAKAAQLFIERKALNKFKLTYPRFLVLLALLENGQLTLGDIADDLGCSRGNLTGIVDRLERDGHVIRDRSKEDRRVVKARLVDPEGFKTVIAAVKKETEGQVPADMAKALDDLTRRLRLGATA
jgi:DNA-binding MarR family transcriptional regulator